MQIVFQRKHSPHRKSTSHIPQKVKDITGFALSSHVNIKLSVVMISMMACSSLDSTDDCQGLPTAIVIARAVWI